MDTSDLKEIIIALINKGDFFLGAENEDTAKEIAKFEKAYFEERENN